MQELAYESIEQMEKSERYCSIIYGNLDTWNGISDTWWEDVFIDKCLGNSVN